MAACRNLTCAASSAVSAEEQRNVVERAPLCLEPELPLPQLAHDAETSARVGGAGAGAVQLGAALGDRIAEGAAAGAPALRCRDPFLCIAEQVVESPAVRPAGSHAGKAETADFLAIDLDHAVEIALARTW